jgi:hypothetical protein
MPLADACVDIGAPQSALATLISGVMRPMLARRLRRSAASVFT